MKNEGIYKRYSLCKFFMVFENDAVKKSIIFIFSFMLLALYIKDKDMLSSIDAGDIWKTITTFGSSDMYGSYVLYKGLGSVYPYVWLYRLSSFTSISVFIFLKLYHCILFSCITTFFLPNIYKSLTKSNYNIIQGIMLPFICFVIWKYTHIFEFLMIDLPSLALFLIAASEVLNYSQSVKFLKLSVLRLIILCLLIGFGFGYSGQYSLSTLMLAIFFLIQIYKKNRWCFKKRILFLIIKFILIIVLILIPVILNNYFMNTVVELLRENGSWIPSGKAWLNRAFTFMADKYTLLYKGGDIPSTRGGMIITESYGNEYLDSINSQTSYDFLSMKELIKMYLRHPVDIFTVWVNRFFIGLSPHGAYNSLIHLGLFYTFLFITLKKVYDSVKEKKVFYSPNLLIVLAFIFSAAAPVVMTIEARYMICIQSIIIVFGIFEKNTWKKCFSAVCSVCNRIWRKKPEENTGTTINYTLILYILFMIICVTHIGTLYELRAMNNGYILFTWSLF